MGWPSWTGGSRNMVCGCSRLGSLPESFSVGHRCIDRRRDRHVDGKRAGKRAGHKTVLSGRAYCIGEFIPTRSRRVEGNLETLLPRDMVNRGHD